MGLGGFEAREFPLTQQRIVGGDTRQIDREALWPGGIGAACSPAITGGVGGTLCATRRVVLLALGMLDMRQELGAFVCQRHAATQERTGGAHLGGRDIRLRAHSATEPGGNLGGIEGVIVGLPPLDGLPGEGVSEAPREPCIGAEVGAPVPGEQTFDGDDETVSRWSNGCAKGFRMRRHGTVTPRRTSPVEDADGHGTGMQVDPAVQGVRCGGKSH
jgi:hypothetical protein